MTSWRSIVASERDPNAANRRLYTLSCGHVVSRRTNLGKSRAICGHCQGANS